MESECCICFEELDATKLKQDKINCKHIVCRKCIVSFQFKDCPICFKKIEFINQPKKKKQRLNPPYLLPKYYFSSKTLK
jgi:hypothetical protein